MTNRYAYLWLVIATGIWNTLCFVLPDFFDSPTDGWRSVLTVIFYVCALGIGQVAIASLLALHRFVAALCLPLYAVLGAVISYYRVAFHATVNPALVDATLHTNMGTVSGVTSWQLIVWIIFQLLVSLLWVRWRWSIEKVQYAWAIMIGSIGLFAAWYWGNGRLHKSAAQRYPMHVIRSVGEYVSLQHASNLPRQIPHVQATATTDSLDIVMIKDENGEERARGIIARNLVTGRIERFFGHAVVVASGGYGNTFFLSTNAMASNGSAAMQMYRHGAYFANPCYAQIHPTCIPKHGDFQSKLTLMSESLRNDGRIWVPKKLEDAKRLQAGEIKGRDIPEEDRDYYLERRYPAFGNLVPRDVASRAAKERCDKGYGVNNTGLAVFLDFSDAIQRLGKDVVAQKYGNLFQMYEKIVDENPYENPMMIFPAIHYTMGGIWVDYELQTSVKGLFCIGEANFSDHGANRLGASALMQGLADGYFVLPYTIQNYLSDQIGVARMSTDRPEFAEAEKRVQDKIDRLMKIQGKRSVDSIHKELGLIMWDFVGMGRTAEGLKTAIEKIDALKKEFWSNVYIPGEAGALNNELEKALRLADFIEIGRLMAVDALHREESCGGHFREEYQTPEGEALRQDDKFSYVACWHYMGEDKEPELIKEPLDYEFTERKTRNYKN